MAPRLAFLSATLFAVAAAALPAQDAIVTQPEFLSPETASGDAPPEFKHRVGVDYPEDLVREDIQGYALIFWLIDPKGDHVIYASAATHPLFARASRIDRKSAATKPIMKAGQPVAGLLWHSVIFNPASAGTAKKNANPRLLSVWPVLVEGKGRLGKVHRDSLPVVWIKAQIDAGGAITGFDLEDPAAQQFHDAIAATLPKWKIAPARKDGVPFATAWRLPVVLCPPMRNAVAESAVTPPRVLFMENTAYPSALAKERLRGEVTLSILIDAKGSVEDVAVIRSNHPVFSQLAERAVRNWRFSPATKDGKPVPITIQQTVIFSPSYDPRVGEDPTTLTGGDPNKLPPQFRYDTPPHVIGATLPVYPYEDYVARRKGSATVLLLIDQQGKIAQTKVLAASSPAFGLALAAAAEESTFTPALKKGQPTPTLIRREEDFEPDGRDLLTTDRDWRIFRRLQKDPSLLAAPGKLDRPLKPAMARRPLTPTAHRSDNSPGSAVVEFIVDQDGNVLLPKILKASAPEFGYAAVQAIKQWKFEIPTVGGKPVLVRVSVPFDFRGQGSVP